MKRRDVLALALAALSVPALVPRPAYAQAKYPDRPIRLVIPYPPGGVYDATGRPWAEKAKTLLGTIVIENIGGAGSSLGTAAAARAQPDGYTLLLGGNSGLVINPLASSKSPYDPLRDFEPIAILGRNPTAIDVHPAQPMKTLKELVDFIKANPGKVSYGSSGVGTPNHLIGERLKLLAGLDMAHVPYRGSGPSMSDLISGHIPVLFQSVTGQAIEMHKAGKLRMLATTSEQRLEAAPEIPTVEEAGCPDLTARQFIGLFAPKGTPRPIVEQIAQATRSAMADPELQRLYVASGFDPDVDSNPAKARRQLEDEIAKWRPVIQAIQLKLE
jgi:tripartite-type tricarboxylate transporter receptor subunit TctC